MENVKRRKLLPPKKNEDDNLARIKKHTEKRWKRIAEEIAKTFYKYHFVFVPDASPTVPWEYQKDFKLYAKGIGPSKIQEFFESPNSGFTESGKGYYKRGKYALKYVTYNKIKENEFNPSLPSLEDFLPGITVFSGGPILPPKGGIMADRKKYDKMMSGERYRTEEPEDRERRERYFLNMQERVSEERSNIKKAIEGASEDKLERIAHKYLHRIYYWPDVDSLKYPESSGYFHVFTYGITLENLLEFLNDPNNGFKRHERGPYYHEKKLNCALAPVPWDDYNGEKISFGDNSFRDEPFRNRFIWGNICDAEYFFPGLYDWARRKDLMLPFPISWLI